MNKLFLKFLNKLEHDIAVFVLCDGYDGWSWGKPYNPIILNYTEYLKLKNYLIRVFQFDIADAISTESSYDCILPEKIANLLGKKIAQICYLCTSENEVPTEENWDNYFYQSKEEKQKSIKAKEALLQKLGFSNVAIDKIAYCGVSKRQKVRLQIDRWNKNKYRKQVRTKLQKHCIRLQRVRAEDAHRLRQRHFHRIRVRPGEKMA